MRSEGWILVGFLPFLGMDFFSMSDPEPNVVDVCFLSIDDDFFLFYLIVEGVLPLRFAVGGCIPMWFPPPLM